MLDIKRIREDYDNVKAAVEKRCKGDFGLSEVPGLDIQRRYLNSKKPEKILLPSWQR